MGIHTDVRRPQIRTCCVHIWQIYLLIFIVVALSATQNSVQIITSDLERHIPACRYREFASCLQSNTSILWLIHHNTSAKQQFSFLTIAIQCSKFFRRRNYPKNLKHCYKALLFLNFAFCKFFLYFFK